MIDFVKLDQMDDPDDILKTLRMWEIDELQRYQPLHREWEKNLLFFLGKQWLEEKHGIDGYIILDEDDEHYRPVSNETARLCRLKRSQITGKGIRPRVRPYSDNYQDIRSSRLGDLALRAREVIDDEQTIRTIVAMHAQIFGVGWQTIFKQPSPFEFISNPVSDENVTDYFQCKSCGYVAENSQACPQCHSPEMQYKRDIQVTPRLDPATNQPIVNNIPIYKIISDAVDPFRIRVSPAHTERGLRWLTDSSVQPVSWLKDTFNVLDQGYLGEEQIKKIKADSVLPRGLKISQQYLTSVTLTHSSVSKGLKQGKADFENRDDTAVLSKTYIYPTKKRPMGRLLIWTKYALLYDEKPDVPQAVKFKRWHPYIPFIWDLHPLRFEGIPYIEDLIPTNKKINSLQAIILEHLDRQAAPERYEFDNVLKNNDDGSDGVLRLEPRPELPHGGIPGYLTGPSLAAEVYKMLDNYRQEIERQGNVTAIVQGERPAGVDTYRGLRLLRDAADSSESELYNRYYKYVRECGHLKLSLIQECLNKKDDELAEQMEILKYNESYGDVDVQNFLGEDLRSNLNIVMEADDFLSESTDAETDRVKDFLSDRLLDPNDISDPYTKIKLMRKLGQSDMPLPAKADIEKAERISALFESGEFMKAKNLMKPQDAKPVFLRVWSDWIKSAKFESLDPKIQGAAVEFIASIETQLLNTQPPGPSPQGGPPLPPGKAPPHATPPALQ